MHMHYICALSICALCLVSRAREWNCVCGTNESWIAKMTAVPHPLTRMNSIITHRATTLYFSTIWTLRLSCPGTSIRVQLPACEIKNILPLNQKCVTRVPHNLRCNDIKSLTRSFLLLYVALFSVMDVWVLTNFPSNNWKTHFQSNDRVEEQASACGVLFKWNGVSHLSEQKSFARVTESQQQHSGPRFTGPPKIPKEH